MVDQALKSTALPAPHNRLAALGRATGKRRKPEGGPAELTARHKLLIEYMVHGVEHASICERVLVERPVTTPDGTAMVERHPRLHEPLTLIEAADLLRIKRRNARELSTLPIFRQEYERLLAVFRESERARNLHTLVEIRDDPGLGKAADRKVRIQAAGLLSGEIGGSPTVNVSIGSTQIAAGIVIERWHDPDAPADEPHGNALLQPDHSR